MHNTCYDECNDGKSNLVIIVGNPPACQGCHCDNSCYTPPLCTSCECTGTCPPPPPPPNPCESNPCACGANYGPVNNPSPSPSPPKCTGARDKCGVCNGDGSSCAVPCVDNDGNKANPLKDMSILPAVNSGAAGGTFGCVRNGSGCPGNNTKKQHRGIDLDAPIGADVYNMFDGEVIQVQQNHVDFGILIIVESTVNGEATQVWYSHLSEESVAVGQTYSQGDIIGKTGESGNADNPGSAGPHLHLTIRQKNAQGQWKKINPKDFIAGDINTTDGSIDVSCE